MKKDFTFNGYVKNWFTNDCKTIDAIYFQKVIGDFIKNSNIVEFQLKEVSRIHTEGKCKIAMQLTW